MYNKTERFAIWTNSYDNVLSPVGEHSVLQKKNNVGDQVQSVHSGRRGPQQLRQDPRYGQGTWCPG